jgi:hypothetical protein
MSTPKKKPGGKQQAEAQIHQDVIDIVGRLWPIEQDTQEYPFRGEGRNVRLTFEQQEILKKTVGFPVTKSRLKSFLAKECNVQNPQDYSISDILDTLELWLAAREKPTEASDKIKREPLSDNQAAVYDLLKNLPEHKAKTGKEILQELQNNGLIIDQSTLTKNIIPALRPYGVKNKRGAGYYIPK